jgi:3-hydroxyisobutyrate dehydrogenase-like beta-hydroxyacid dehydrogenase
LKPAVETLAAQDFTASFELVMARKDLGLMLEAAEGQDLAVLPGLAARMDAMIGAGYGAMDMSVIARQAISD